MSAANPVRAVATGNSIASGAQRPRTDRRAFGAGSLGTPTGARPPSSRRSAVAEAAEAGTELPAGCKELRLYNTMSRKKERFTPRADQGNAVSMYVCGVTVYDYSHIGHARVYVAFDVLARVLAAAGYDVTYCRNFTDIDDKIIKRAAEAGEDPLALSARFIEEFRSDMRLLNCAAPDLEPKATDHVAGMIGTIERIIEHGHGYATEAGDVYFDVSSLEGYGRLSGRRQEDNLAGASQRVGAAEAGAKRDAADFALWKSAKPGEPTWDSPWGAGRPGWHIECSSMIRELLGPVVDIHGGGMDLTFPHHENELAQSQAAACGCDRDHMPGGVDFVRYWVHNGFVNVDSEKMSKSLGNFFTIRDVLERFHPMAMRWFLVSTHYRQPVNYSVQALEEASCRLFYVLSSLRECRAALDAAGADGEAARAAAGAGVDAGEGPGGEMWAQVDAALRDDLSTPEATAALSAPLRLVNELTATKKGRKRPDRLQVLAGLELAVSRTLALLGIQVETQGECCMSAMRALCLSRQGLTEADVAARIADRADARREKDFARGDAIRDELEARGVLLMDTPEGTTWQPGVPSAPCGDGDDA